MCFKRSLELLRIVIFTNLIVWLFPIEAKPQSGLQVTSGNSVQFSITTLSQYTEVRTVGKTLSYTTNLRITIENLAEPDWRVVMYATENNIPFFGAPADNIPLNALKLTAIASPAGLPTGYGSIIASPFSPTASPGTEILSGSGDGLGTPIVVLLTISYTLNNDMSVKPDGLYFVELSFDLWTKPTIAIWP